MKIISIVTPCFNEELNVQDIYLGVRQNMLRLPEYCYEHIFIDNASTDSTVDILKKIARKDKNVKIIVNAKNFGPYRSPLHAFFQSKGDAVIPIAADLENPPELIVKFIQKWQEGYKIVAGIKEGSSEKLHMRLMRKMYYKLIAFLSEDVEQINNFSGFALYDREVMDLIKNTNDHYPYVRGLIGDMGFPIAKVNFYFNKRKKGISKNTLYDLYSQGMNGIVHHSKMPLRLSAFIGIIVSAISLLVAIFHIIFKLFNMHGFYIETSPLIIGLFFFSGLQLLFFGISGEYLGAIHSKINQRWLVIERERVNFD